MWEVSREFRSVLEVPFDCLLPLFSYEDSMLSAMFIVISERALLEVLSLSTQNYCLLLPGIPAPSTEMSCGSLVSFFPVRRDSEVLGGNTSWLRSDVLGSILPTCYYFLLWWGRSWHVVFPSLWQDLFMTVRFLPYIGSNFVKFNKQHSKGTFDVLTIIYFLLSNLEIQITTFKLLNHFV